MLCYAFLPAVGCALGRCTCGADGTCAASLGPAKEKVRWKRENFDAAVGLHFAYYNFVKRHNTLRCTPAMAAGVERDFWSVGELLEAVA
jgi:hypothetical protein